MTDKTEPDGRLDPCPFCGAGETHIHINRGTWRGIDGYGEPVSVEVRHWCPREDGQPSRGLFRVGRDEASAIAAWNRRTPPATDAMTVLQGLRDEGRLGSRFSPASPMSAMALDVLGGCGIVTIDVAAPAAGGDARSAEELARDLKSTIDTATELCQQLKLMEEHARGEVWRWQADGADNLATMGNRMGVLIYASDLRNLLAATPQPAAPAATPSFQQRVHPWLLDCFGAEIAADCVERNHRFLEEALELVQSLGCSHSEAHQLVDYVFGRPIGEPGQEVGGVMVTLAALCLANDLDMHKAGEVELARISVPELTAKIRAKQAAKPKHSPLPAANQQPAPDLSTLTERGKDAWAGVDPQALREGRAPLTDTQIDTAARVLAARMDYPWEHMPQQGRAEMRKHAQAVITAARAHPGTNPLPGPNVPKPSF